MVMKTRKISVGAAFLLIVGVLGAAAAFAWFFLRGRVRVEHTVTVPEDEVTVHYTPTVP
jgi:hypothetical protein